MNLQKGDLFYTTSHPYKNPVYILIINNEQFFAIFGNQTKIDNLYKIYFHDKTYLQVFYGRISIYWNK